MLQVIIGRFQTNKLHQGHLELIKQVKATGNDILVLIGTTAATGTDKNPLSFEVRRHLFDTYFNNTPIIELKDAPSDKDWSNQIDYIIESLGFTEARIWGGRDNSIEGYYHGKHEIELIESAGNHSATATRKEIAKEPINCPNFRAGIIHHVENRYPIVYSTVDVALYNNQGEFLMGKKGNKFMFIGGFVDPTDYSLIEAASRELKEETGIKARIKYYDSFKVDDTRYKKTKDCIMTHLFVGRYNELPKEEDIIDKEFTEFRYLNRQDINLVSPTHKYMFELLLTENY